MRDLRIMKLVVYDKKNFTGLLLHAYTGTLDS